MPQPEITTSPLEPNIRSVDSMPQHAGVELHDQVSKDGANPPAAQSPNIMWPLPRTIRTPILLRPLAKHEHYDRMVLLSLEYAAWGFFTAILDRPCRAVVGDPTRRSHR